MSIDTLKQGVQSALEKKTRRLLTTGELCEWLGIGQKAAENWRHCGKGPRYLKFGKLVRYDEADVLAWLDQQKRDNTTQRARPALASA